MQALGFYKKVGYCVDGDEFMEDGILQRRIQKSIQPPDLGDVEPDLGFGFYTYEKDAHQEHSL